MATSTGRNFGGQIASLNDHVSMLESGADHLIQNTDLNTITATGQYRIYTGCTNIPNEFTSDGILIVENSFNVSNSYCKQTLRSSTNEWTRLYVYGTWGTWSSLSDQIANQMEQYLVGWASSITVKPKKNYGILYVVYGASYVGFYVYNNTAELYKVFESSTSPFTSIVKNLSTGEITFTAGDANTIFVTFC